MMESSPQPVSDRREASSSLVSRAFAVSAMISLGWFFSILYVKLMLYRGGALTGDIAQYANALFNTGRGVFLYSDIGMLRDGQQTFLSEHFAPTLALLAPLYHLFRTPALLLVVHAGSLALAGLTLSAVARWAAAWRGLKGAVAICMPIAVQVLYLCHPSTVISGLDATHGFHHDSMIPLLLTGVVLLSLKKRWVSAMVLFVLLIGLKENLPILGGILVVSLLIFKVPVPKKVLAVMMASCVIMFAGSVVFQHMRGNRHVSTVVEILFIDGLGGVAAWWPLLLFLPALFCPVILLPLAAEFILHLAGGSNPNSWRSMVLVSGGGIGTCMGLAWLTDKLRGRYGLAAVKAMAIGVLVVCVLPALLLGGRAYAETLAQARRVESSFTTEEVEEVSRDLPPDASVAVTSDLLLPMVNRHHLVWPDDWKCAHFVLLSETGSHPDDVALRDGIAEVVAEGRMEEIHSTGALKLYRLLNLEDADMARQQRLKRRPWRISIAL